MNTEDMLKLQAGYRNTIIPYPVEAYKRKKKNFTTRTGIYEIELVTNKPFVEEVNKKHSYNIVYKSQSKMAMNYIENLRKLEEQGRMREYNNKVEYIYKIMNSYQEPVQWVNMVYQYLKK